MDRIVIEKPNKDREHPSARLVETTYPISWYKFKGENDTFEATQKFHTVKQSVTTCVSSTNRQKIITTPEMEDSQSAKITQIDNDTKEMRNYEWDRLTTTETRDINRFPTTGLHQQRVFQ